LFFIGWKSTPAERPLETARVWALESIVLTSRAPSRHRRASEADDMIGIIDDARITMITITTISSISVNALRNEPAGVSRRIADAALGAWRLARLSIESLFIDSSLCCLLPTTHQSGG
jgi:hypothetical protein